MASIAYNPLDPKVHADPYPHYRELREQEPVHHSDALGLWILTRYDDVAALLRDARLGHEVTEGFAEGGSADWESMLFRDPPSHTRLRGLVSKAFTPRMLESLRPRIQSIVDHIVGVARDTGEIDVIGDLAFPLPATVISEMLGLPVEDHEQCRRWASTATRSLDPLVGDREMEEVIFLSLIEFRQYLSEQVERRRAQPGTDLVSALIAAEEEGDRLNHEELISTLLLLFTAGHETATNLIGNGMLALLRNPDQLRRLKDNPQLLRPGIEELLRYDSPVQLVIRIAKSPLTVRGSDFVRGDSMLLVIAAANRDPEQFADPDVLDIGRKDVKHLSFGGGIHFCLGATLARMEAQIALGALISQFDKLELAADDLRWRPHVNLRGLESLPLRVA